VQLFAVARGFPGAGEKEVEAALLKAAAAFPELDAGTLQTGSSAGGRLAFAAIAHPPGRAGPRRYFARDGDRVAMYDGLPLPVHDARALLERWDGLELEGIFNAVRLDLAAGTVDWKLDVLGMAKLYVARRSTQGPPGGPSRSAGALVLSNSAEAVRILTGATEPDPLGISSMLGLGWAAGGRTLLRDVEVLPGPLTPRSATPRNNEARRTAGEVADCLTELAAGTAALQPLTAGLTAGRDTRVLLALALAAGLDVDYYTSGHEQDVDVVIARELSAALGLRHELVTPRIPRDWTAATTAFSAQTDGLASFWIVSDWVEHQGSAGPVGLKLWGPGGEIGRSGNIGLSIPFGATMPGLRSSAAVQRRILHRKVDDFGGLVTPEATHTTRAHLDGFVADRLEEGWRPREVAEAYYGFERVRYWASAGVRRASAAADLWSPFVSRPFIDYSWSLTPEERTVEAPHWRILSQLDPRLRDMRFEYPWRPQRPRRASAMVARDVAKKLATRGRSKPAPPSASPFGQAWVDAGADQIRELIAGTPQSPLWDYVDRDALIDRIQSPDEGVTRALTVLWWLHGRHAPPAAPGRSPAAAP
jgi:hypothetical protein